MAITLPQIWELSPGDIDMGAINIKDYLDAGELATGTPVITEIGGSTLTLSNKAVNTSTLTILGESCAAGQAIQVLVSVPSNAAAGAYAMSVTFSTNATPARTKVCKQRIAVV